jgi:hypothetical protein
MKVMHDHHDKILSLKKTTSCHQPIYFSQNSDMNLSRIDCSIIIDNYDVTKYQIF